MATLKVITERILPFSLESVYKIISDPEKYSSIDQKTIVESLGDNKWKVKKGIGSTETELVAIEKNRLIFMNKYPGYTSGKVEYKFMEESNGVKVFVSCEIKTGILEKAFMSKGAIRKEYMKFFDNIQLYLSSKREEMATSITPTEQKKSAIDTFTCPKCGKKVLPEYELCPFCGEALKKSNICKKCGKELKPEFEMCPFCGTPK